MKLIPLSQGKFAKVDDDDYDQLAKHKWHFTTNGYAARKSGDEAIYMHRQIMRAGPSIQIDHRNLNQIDNQKINLRLATRHQNRFNCRKYKTNTTGFKGVTIFKRTGRFQAQIQFKREKHHLGYFETPEQASSAYREASKELHGEFSRAS